MDSSGNSNKRLDQVVVMGSIVENSKVTSSMLKRRLDKAIVDFHGCGVD